MLIVFYFIINFVCKKSNLQININKYYNKKFFEIKTRVQKLIKEEKYEDAVNDINNYIDKNYLINNDYLFELKIMELEALFLNKSEEFEIKLEVFIMVFLDIMSEKNINLFYKYYFLFKYYKMYAENKVNKDIINVLLDINEKYFICQKYNSVGKELEIDKLIAEKIKKLQENRLQLLLEDIYGFDYEVDCFLILLNKYNETEAFEKYNVLYKKLLNIVEINELFDNKVKAEIQKKIKNN